MAINIADMIYRWFDMYMSVVLKFSCVSELPKELLKNTNSWTHLWGLGGRTRVEPGHLFFKVLMCSYGWEPVSILPVSTFKIRAVTPLGAHKIN